MRYQAGVNLIEILIVLAIVGIMAAMGVPRFKHMVDKHNVETAANSIAIAVNIARSEAIHQAKRATLCASDNPLASPPSCGTDWSKGWVLFVGDASAAPPDAPCLTCLLPANTTNIIKVGNALSGVSIVDDSKTGYVIFKPDSTTVSGAVQTLTFTATQCQTGTFGIQSLEIGSIGRIKTKPMSKCP